MKNEGVVLKDKPLKKVFSFGKVGYSDSYGRSILARFFGLGNYSGESASSLLKQFPDQARVKITVEEIPEEEFKQEVYYKMNKETPLNPGKTEEAAGALRSTACNRRGPRGKPLKAPEFKEDVSKEYIDFEKKVNSKGVL